MAATLRSARLYFWPIILANVVAMTIGAGGDVRRMAWFSLVLSSQASFGFLVNDLCDRRIDRVNRAGHFEHSPRPTLILARVTASVLCVGSLALAWALGPGAWMIAVSLAIGLAAYSRVLRRAEVLPNVAGAVFASAPLWAPLVLALSGGARWQWWLVAAVVVLLTAREMLMDVRDRRGDAAGGRKTLATQRGARAAIRVGVGLTATGLVPFCVAVLVRPSTVSPTSTAAAAAVATVIALLLVIPAWSILSRAADGTAIRSYVLRSRLAMALLPVLSLLLSSPV